MPVKRVLDSLERAVQAGQEHMNIEIAKNPELKKAISIVEEFLRKNGRVCYGGQAINSYLPKKYQFYDSNKNLPDYDFFTPNGDRDSLDLIEMLRHAGFLEISKRIGIHKGTVKIYVNYYPVADITEIDADFYLQIRNKANSINGIHYTDPIFLRMMMFLELSRPKGMITRWKKVYERLELLDKAQPLETCKYTIPIFLQKSVMTDIFPTILDFVITNKKVYLGANIFLFYNYFSKKPLHIRSKQFMKQISPIFFLSHDAELDANILKNLLDESIEKREIIGYQNILPAMIGLYKDSILLCLIVQEEACHSYVTIPLLEKKVLRLASLDTFLTFLIGFYYRENDSLLPIHSLLCWIQTFDKVSRHYKHNPSKYIPRFASSCSGYQTSFASLLRSKAARIEAERQKERSVTRKNVPLENGTLGKIFPDKGDTVPEKSKIHSFFTRRKTKY